MTTLLIISIGSLVGQNLLGVLDNRRHLLRVIATNSSPIANLYSTDKVFLVPESADPPCNFSEKLLDILVNEQPDLVIPARDRDATVLARFAQMYPQWAAKCLCGSVQAGEIMEDKWRSFQFCQRHGLPFAASAIADSSEAGASQESVLALLRKFGFPLVAKLRRGFGSHGVNIIFSEAQLQHYLASGSYVFQQYVGAARPALSFAEGLEHGGVPLFYSLEQDKFAIQLCLGPDGSSSEVFTTRHTMGNGVSLSIAAIDDAELTRIGHRFAAAMVEAGYVGPLNIQCQWSDESGYLCYEMSGRFTGATQARYLLGFDELGQCLKFCTGVDLAPCAAFASQAVVLKQQATFLTSESDMAALQRDGYWEKQN